MRMRMRTIMTSEKLAGMHHVQKMTRFYCPGALTTSANESYTLLFDLCALVIIRSV